MRILVIAAHPDDEVIGVGGTIAKHVESGDEVQVRILSEGATARYDRKEISNLKKSTKRASEILGVKNLFFSDLPDQKLDNTPLIDITKIIEGHISQFSPNIIYTHHGGDVNKDHKIVYEATLVAARPLMKSCIEKILCYEVLSSTEWGSPSSNNFIPTVYVDIEKYFDKKISAMKAYESELRKFPHPRSIKAIKIKAQARGLEVGLKVAEAFMLVRELWK